MTIYQDAYHTTAGHPSGIIMESSVKREINDALIRSPLATVNLNVKEQGGIKPVFITGQFDEERKIPLFTHPISVLNNKGFNYLCTDLRFYVSGIKMHENGGFDEKSIKNVTEYNFGKSRAMINLIWLSGGIGQIKYNLSFAGAVYSTWLAQVISKASGLDFQDQTKISIVASLYYQSLFLEQQEFDHDDLQRLAVHTIKVTKAPPEMVMDVFEKAGKLSDIKSFCEAVKAVCENVRLEDFNPVFLLTIIRNSWFGTNAKELIAAALEHPPTWIAIVYTALTQRTFKNSMVYQVAEKAAKRADGHEFVLNYQQMMKELTT